MNNFYFIIEESGNLVQLTTEPSRELILNENVKIYQVLDKVICKYGHESKQWYPIESMSTKTYLKELNNAN